MIATRSHRPIAVVVCLLLCSASQACGDDVTETFPPFPVTQAAQPPVPVAGVTGQSRAGASGSTGTAGAAATAPFPGQGTAPSPSFPVPPPPPGSMCFSCGPGCQDCGFGCECTFPDSNEWVPPFDNVGEPGFRNSTEPLCADGITLFGVDVWSDARGVFALVSSDNVSVNTGLPDTDFEEDAGVTAHPQATQFGMTAVSNTALTQIWINDGNGWKLGLNAFNAATHYGLRGLPGGWLGLHDQGQAEGFDPNMISQPALTECTLGMFHQGDRLECQDVDLVADLIVVQGNLAHALVDETRLLTYDGEHWTATTPLMPFPASRLWADTTRVLALGPLGTAMWLEGDTWTVQETGMVEHFTAVWGNAADDIWAGTAQGNLFHYDGTRWTKRGELSGVTCDNRQPVEEIWGSGDQVYFITRTSFARWNGTQLESLANWSCSLGLSSRSITGMWGNAADEVFLSLTEPFRMFDRCASAFIVRFDGSEFHRM